MTFKNIFALMATLFTSVSFGATSHAVPPSHPLQMLIFPGLLIAVFYFLLIRPQNKRAKMQKDMQEQIAPGDEIMTAGGIYARVVRLKDDHVEVEVSNGVTIRLQLTSIATVLPKGTLKD